MGSVLLAITIPSQLGVEFNLRVVESFAKYVAPALGWKPDGERDDTPARVTAR
ncbi:hypothetical protein [Microbacterium caowuchunii]|uniref:hypothetical protein n=1 Tax=Microbacterium caowuchunii TaxID=2614638 RepID=UPI00177EFC91|nr:hypothetical protein [Microbacterium caowuchunii]